jgi:hypothetical protein
MTVVDEPALIETLPRPEQVAVLQRQACDFHPRKFAIFGIYEALPGIFPEEPFLGWGLDLGDNEGTVFWEPSSKDARCADSPDTILRSLRRMGEVHLVWLEND